MILISLYLDSNAVDLSDSWVKVEGHHGLSYWPNPYVFNQYLDRDRTLDHNDTIEMLLRGLYTFGPRAKEVRDIGDIIYNKIFYNHSAARNEIEYEPEILEILAEGSPHLVASYLEQKMVYLLMGPLPEDATEPLILSLKSNILIRRKTIIQLLSDPECLSIMGPLSAFILLTSHQLDVKDKSRLQYEVFRFFDLPASSELFQSRFDSFWAYFDFIPGLALPQQMKQRNYSERNPLYWRSNPIRDLDRTAWRDQDLLINVISKTLFVDSPLQYSPQDRQKLMRKLSDILDSQRASLLFTFPKNILFTLKYMEDSQNVPANEFEELNNIKNMLMNKIASYIADIDTVIRNYSHAGIRSFGYQILMGLFVDAMKLNVCGCFVSKDVMKRLWAFEGELEESVPCVCHAMNIHVPKCPMWCHLRDPFLFYNVVVPMIQYARDSN